MKVLQSIILLLPMFVFGCNGTKSGVESSSALSAFTFPSEIQAHISMSLTGDLEGAFTFIDADDSALLGVDLMDANNNVVAQGKLRNSNGDLVTYLPLTLTGHALTADVKVQLPSEADPNVSAYRLQWSLYQPLSSQKTSTSLMLADDRVEGVGVKTFSVIRDSTSTSSFGFTPIEAVCQMFGHGYMNPCSADDTTFIRTQLESVRDSYLSSFDPVLASDFSSAVLFSFYYAAIVDATFRAALTQKWGTADATILSIARRSLNTVLVHPDILNDGKVDLDNPLLHTAPDTWDISSYLFHDASVATPTTVSGFTWNGQVGSTMAPGVFDVPPSLYNIAYSPCSASNYGYIGYVGGSAIGASKAKSIALSGDNWRYIKTTEAISIPAGVSRIWIYLRCPSSNGATLTGIIPYFYKIPGATDGAKPGKLMIADYPGYDFGGVTSATNHTFVVTNTGETEATVGKVSDADLGLKVALLHNSDLRKLIPSEGAFISLSEQRLASQS